MPLDTIKTTEEWGFIYCRATGSCKYGVESFINQNAKKKKYTLAEILEKTKGQYGADQFKKAVGE
jgi:hypothetical protein